MRRFLRLCGAIVASNLFVAAAAAQISRVEPGCGEGTYLSPTALAVSRDQKTLYVGCATANRLLFLELATRKVVKIIATPAPPLGLALASDGTRLFVTCAAPESKTCVFDAGSGQLIATIPSGHTSMAPVLSPDGKSLYVCNRFNNEVSVIDLGRMQVAAKIPVQREPVVSAMTADGKFLLVANHLPNARADTGMAAAVVSVISLAAKDVVKEIELPNGSGALKDIRVSPDGKYAVVSHVLGRFNRPASIVYRGWMNVNTLSVIDLAKMEFYNTAILDDMDAGAANPWGVAWAANGTNVIVAHAGTHEISIVDFPFLLKQLVPLSSAPARSARLQRTRSPLDDPAEFLSFLRGSHPRLKLPDNDLGPRAVVVAGATAIVANYFSDTLTIIDLAASPLRMESVPLAAKREMDVVRKGELYFHDGTLCYQRWQSCSTCHPGDARADGLNWDLLNDGMENPKNTKSLLLAHQTPPAMSLGVRETAESAVRSGIRHILFTNQPEPVAFALDAYLKSLKTVPSPYLEHGTLSDAAKRGQQLFIRSGCASCHPPGVFTDLHRYEVGTRGLRDQSTDQFDTPTLIELWRTAPYLHDGSAATLRDVLVNRNPNDQHGKTSNLSVQEIDDLCAFLLSL